MIITIGYTVLANAIIQAMGMDGTRIDTLKSTLVLCSDHGRYPAKK